MTAMSLRRPAGATSLQQRIEDQDWNRARLELDAVGCAVLPQCLTPQECTNLASLYTDDKHFRSHIHMARHGFGKGEYKYFSYPLPGLIAGLRSALYPHLAAVANAWNERMKIAT